MFEEKMTLEKQQEGGYKLLGWIEPLLQEVKRQGDVLVLKSPGHTYWNGRGQKWPFTGTEYKIFRVLSEKDGKLECTEIISFPVRKGKEGKK